MTKRILIPLAIAYCSLCFKQNAYAQPMWTINLIDSVANGKRAEKFENRRLGSEKMADKKFTVVRHFFQNNFTHYNYYFNANNKINAVLERAKAIQIDDFSKLLSYYPFTFENTAAQKTELDSVIYKATSGILLHDLRNDWIDNMYLLMGKAYFLKKDFDSAANTFQFINYNLFPRKKNEDENKVVGTADTENKQQISIANKEKRNIAQKILTQPPSRNDALIWLARTQIEQDELGDAAGLINILQHDPNLPKRLQDDLADVNAYWYYKQGIYDSTAAYLEQALTVQNTKLDKSRAEFLLAQLFEKTNQYNKASIFYNKASAHTTNPLLNIYAQLNDAKMRKGNDIKELDRGISNLVKLSKKDNFEKFNDIIFYAAGELALLKPDTNQAIILFTKSYQKNENNIVYKNKAFLQLADIAYNRKAYQLAFNFYDSLQSGDTTLADRLDQIQTRRNALSKIVEKISTIQREDSLQMIAAMPALQRDAFVKKLAKKLRKAKGLKEEDVVSTEPLLSFDNNKDAPTDLFASTGKNTGEWYFYNSGVKAKGFSDFKRKWGTRTNVDNWRRKSATSATSKDNAATAQDNMTALNNVNPDDVDAITTNTDTQNGKLVAGGKITRTPGGGSPEPLGKTDQQEDITFEGLMANLPLDEIRLTASKNTLAVNMYLLAKLYQEELEDYQQAIDTYDTCLLRFPDSLYNGALYFGMYYCYTKLGNNAKANYYRNLIKTNFANSQSYKILSNPSSAKPTEKNTEGTNRYQAIYNLFIEGKFAEALAEKQKADSLFGTNFWSPQLLYIEAVHHIKQKNDSVAIAVLSNIGKLYPASKLKPKADKMIDVLKRRKEIEDYLTALQITRLKEDSVIVEPVRVRMIRDDNNLLQPKKQDSSKTIIKPLTSIAPVKDSLLNVAKTVSGPYVINAAHTHYIVMLLDKVDGTYVNESKNAMARYVADNFRVQAITVTKDAIDKDNSLLIFSIFTNAAEAIPVLTKMRKAAPDELSWLPTNKYSFIIIDEDNLTRLKNTKDINGYKALLKAQFAGTF